MTQAPKGLLITTQEYKRPSSKRQGCRQFGSEMCQQSPDRHLGAVDTIRNTHTVIGIPGEYQTRAMRHESGNMGYTVQMSDVVLGHRLQVASEAHSVGRTSKAKQLPQVVDDSLLYRRIGVRQLLLLQSANHKGAQ